jgi:hypothetical protein
MAGFDRRNAVLLERCLLALARSGVVVREQQSPHGVKYVVDGVVATPQGRIVRLRTVWSIGGVGEQPRLVTAYPAPDIL